MKFFLTIQNFVWVTLNMRCLVRYLENKITDVTIEITNQEMIKAPHAQTSHRRQQITFVSTQQHEKILTNDMA